MTSTPSEPVAPEPRVKTRSNRPTRIVQWTMVLGGILWAFFGANQDLANCQISGFLIALAISWWLTPEIRARAVQLKLVDMPGERRVHTVPTPRLGGVAIYIAVMVSVISLIAICGRLPHTARGSEGGFIGIAVGGTVIFILGLMDDLGGIPAKIKLVVQVLAACAAYSMGVRIKSIPIPEWIAQGFKSVPLPDWLNNGLPPILHLSSHFNVHSHLSSYGIELGFALGIFLTVLWLVGIANAVNLIDGMDGLAAGVSAISALTIWSVSLAVDRPYAALVAAVLAGALLGFLRWNFNPARIFLGDSGAYLTGFILAALSITGVIKGVTTATLIVPTFILAFLIFFFPILDTTWAIVRRLSKGVSPFTPDAGHIHHRLLKHLKYNQKKVAYLIYGMTATLGLIAAWVVGQQWYFLSLCAGVILMAVFFAEVLNRNRQRKQILPGEVPQAALDEEEKKGSAQPLS
ncbi:MraY family glycosyltransferase [soil metagenome]